MALLSRNKKSLRTALVVILTLSVMIVPLALFPANASQTYALSITAQTDKQDYYIREPLTVQGTFTQDGQPVADGLVAMEVRGPNDQPFAYRTVQMGNASESYVVSIVEAKLENMSGYPITVAKVNTVVQLKISVRNNLWNDITVTIACTVYDNNLIPAQSLSWRVTIKNQATTTVASWVYIPEWAKPGKAMISSNVFSQLLKDGGTPYTSERLDYFDIVINDQLPPPASQPPTSYQTQPGQYQIYLKTSPDRYAPPGIYPIYVEGRVNVTYRASTTANFNVLDYPSLPQASFTFYPPKLYENMTGTFDASSSSAEGYNDTIIRYEWMFNDPYNPAHIIKEGNYTNPPSATVTHMFPRIGTFTVDLNVTDNQGLWTTTTKPITIYPEFGPTANFTWTPTTVYANKTTPIFNASISTLGWSAQTKQYSPIVQYRWDFGDGTGIVNTSTPTINHTYRETGNMTVILTVTDAVGRTNTTSKVVEVLFYSFPWDVNRDGYVGIDDIFLVATHFGMSEGDPGWDPIYDINSDGYVGVDDIFEVAMHFGEEAP